MNDLLTALLGTKGTATTRAAVVGLLVYVALTVSDGRCRCRQPVHARAATNEVLYPPLPK